MNNEKISSKHILILIILCYFFFIFGNNIISLSNPDEVFYTLTAKEMIGHKTWMTPYLFGQPQFEKPIFLYWMMRLSFIFLGINSFSARLPPALFAMLGIIAIYLISLVGFKNRKKAFITGIILMSSGLYIGLARTVFTDMIFSVSILFSMLAFFWGYSNPGKKLTSIILFSLCSSIAVLTKGPLGFFIPCLTIFIFLAIKKDLKYLISRYWFWGILILLVSSLPWYILMVKKYGSSFTYEFFYNDHIRRVIEAEHLSNDTWYFYPFSMIWGLFPWSLYFIASFIFLVKKIKQKTNHFYLFLASWITAVFIIFQPAHSKLVSYIFPLFPALGIITGDFIYESSLNKKNRAIFYTSLATAIILIIICLGSAIASFKFSDYILKYTFSKFPIYLFLCLLSLLTILFFVMVIKRYFLKSIYILMFFIPVFFAIVPLINKYIDPYLSSRDICAYLLKNYKVDNVILCSKFFARGVRYYTSRDVAVIDIPGKKFFSPHPIPFLDTDQKVRDFLDKQPVTYCILKKSSVEDIDRLAKQYKVNILKVIGNETLLKIEP